MTRDAILTCAGKPTWVSLIYRTEPTTKKCKTGKLKIKKRICLEVTVNSLGNPCSQSWRRKGRLRWEGFAEKVLSLEWESEGDGILIIISMNVSSINDRIRFYSEMPVSASNTIRTREKRWCRANTLIRDNIGYGREWWWGRQSGNAGNSRVCILKKNKNNNTKTRKTSRVFIVPLSRYATPLKSDGGVFDRQNCETKGWALFSC